MSSLIFYIFAFITVISAGGMVFSRNVIYSAFSLLFTFFGVAGLYVFLGADFLAATQVMIYVGGILVLLLFGVMLSHRITSVELRTGTLQIVPAILVISGVLLLLLRVVYGTEWTISPTKDYVPTTASLGVHFMTDYLIPLEAVSVILLIALVGAAYIARRER
jgi:NADH-quinone oxidoreductase subunit J